MKKASCMIKEETDGWKKKKHPSPQTLPAGLPPAPKAIWGTKYKVFKGLRGGRGEGKKTHGLYLKPITTAGTLGRLTAAHSGINLLGKSIWSPADELIDQLSVVRKRVLEGTFL